MARRRGNGEGTITRRKDGRWEARYTIGARRQTIYGKTRREVEEKLTKAKADRNDGLIYEAGSMTLAEYLQGWLTDAVRDTVRQRTYERYEQIVRVHLVPAWPRIKLKKLTSADVRRLYREKLDSGLAPRTVQYIHTTLHKALKQAVADGLLPRNVAAVVKAPRLVKKEINPLSPEQAWRFLEAVREDRIEALYVLAIHRGLRQGELLGLK